MNPQNELNPSSSYYNYYQTDYQNPNPNLQSDQFHASAPPDPSIYYSSDYNHGYAPNYDHHNLTPHTFDPNNAVYDPNWNRGQFESPKVPAVAAVRFDDYGRPIGNDDPSNSVDQGVYQYRGGSGNGNAGNGESVSAPAVVRFDDYGRPIGNEERGGGESVKAKARVEVSEDMGSGVQKFRVVLLSEGGGGQGDMDVLCQIGLDGIRVLDPSTSRTLKVYSLDTVTRWEVLDSNIFAFWTRSSIDINERRVRLKSNSYTTTNILDMVAAASIQFKEMDGMTVSEQVAEKKKGFPDWINLMKPGNEEKDHWVPDEASTKCTSCSSYFGAFLRRHHCRNCGDIFCDKCTQGRIALTAEENAPQVRVCDHCMAEVTQRMSHVNEVANRASGYNRHEELAKKLQEEMEKKRKMTPDPVMFYQPIFSTNLIDSLSHKYEFDLIL
ncbi:FREE1-like protein [Tanacetum coccineum]|uniref:FREE1-like protein n=1 Tax=Tanacetum coccineum TaxID=301880 RepID=A0ABQ5FTN9_9ASTR